MTVTHHAGFQVIVLPAEGQKAQKQSLLRRLSDMLFAAGETRAQRAVDEYVARHGGRLTDSLEREIGERALDGGLKFGR